MESIEMSGKKLSVGELMGRGMELDEMNHKVGFALTDADLCVHSTLTGFMITAEDGSKFRIVLEKYGE